MKNKVITFHGNKGGIGKTTLMLNVAYYLASEGKNILIIDADGQGSTTTIIKKNMEDLTEESYKWFSLNGKTKEETQEFVKQNLIKTIKPSKIENIDLVNGGRILYEFAQDLTTKIGKEMYLGRNLQVFKGLSNKYDYIFIDLNPSFDVLALNVYLAADSIIQVCGRDEMGFATLQESLLDWENKSELLNRKNLIKALIFNRVSSNAVSKEIFETIYNLDSTKNLILKTFIPENAAIEKSVTNSKTAKWTSDLKRLNNWKPTKTLEEFLTKMNINWQQGNPIINLTKELIEKGIL